MVRFLRLALLAMQFGCLRRYGAVILSRILSDRAYDETSDIAFRRQFTAGMRGRGKRHCDALDADGPDCGFKSCLGGRIRIDGAALRNGRSGKYSRALEYIEQAVAEQKKRVRFFGHALLFACGYEAHVAVPRRDVRPDGLRRRQPLGVRSRCRESRTATPPKEPSRPLPRLFSCPAGLWR